MNKILLITSNIAPYRLRWCEELANYYDVTIAYTKDHDYERDDRWLRKSSNKCHIIKLKNDKDLYDALCFDVIKLIKNNKDSLIIFDGYGPKTNLLGLAYCKLINRITFTNVDGYALGEKKDEKKDKVKRFVISNLCTYFFCSSEDSKKHLISYGANEDRIVVHNFSSIEQSQIIDEPLTKQEKLNIRKILNIETDKPIILSVGAFIPRKRYEDLIQAVINCQSDCELYLVGGQPTEEYLRLSEGHDNIHYVDFVLPEDVDEYYLASNIFVLPSQTDVWGLVINEAMAKGLPIISSDNCIAAKSLIDSNGLIYKTGDIDSLSQAIDYCLENEHKMALRSLNNIKDYTIENMVAKQRSAIDGYFEDKL